MKEKTTKKQLVLDYLRTHGDITPIEAWQEFNVMRLADLIFQAKKAGWQINTEPQHRTNRAGQKITYAKYVLLSDPEGNAFQRRMDTMSQFELERKDPSISTHSKKRLVERPVRYKKGVDTAADHAVNVIKLGQQELKTQNLFDGN